MANQTDYQYTWGNQVDGFLHTMQAEGAISEGQLLELGTAGRQVKTHTTTTTTPVIGIAHHDCATGEEIVMIAPGPVRKVISDGNIARGEIVFPSGGTAGAAQSKAYADGATLIGCVGVALETGDSAGERVPVMCGWPGIFAGT